MYVAGLSYEDFLHREPFVDRVSTDYTRWSVMPRTGTGTPYHAIMLAARGHWKRQVDNEDPQCYNPSF